jgi:hypothetical protein
MFSFDPGANSFIFVQNLPMALNSIMKIFMPKDKIFYSLFEEVADGVAKMGKLLKNMVKEQNAEKRASLASLVEDQEHINDDLTHKVFTELGRNFITPSTAKTFTTWRVLWMISAIIFIPPPKRSISIR